MINQEQLILWTFILTRCTGVVLLNPILGRRNIPGIVRSGFIMALTLLVFTYQPQQIIEITGFAQYSLGGRKSFTNKRGSMGLAADNFLTNGMRFTSALKSAQFNQDFRQYIYNSSIRLTFSYKIGSLKGAKIKKGKSEGSDEE